MSERNLPQLRNSELEAQQYKVLKIHFVVDKVTAKYNEN